jgi:putative transposase
MNTYKRHRFPPDIISHAVWLYYRFNLSHRDIEDLLAERGIAVSRESIRLWCIKFGALYARRLKRKHQGYGDRMRRPECESVECGDSSRSGRLRGL